MSAALAVAFEPSPDHEALRRLLLRQLAALEDHEPAARLGEDADSLRRFRVATRRIRALVRAARPLLDPGWAEPLRGELGWLGATTGPARDLDVLVAHVRAVSAGFEPGERFALARAVRQLEAERQEAHAALAEVLASERYAALVFRLRRDLAAPVFRASALAAPDLAAAELRRLRKTYRALGGTATDEELHALRLRVKRARYAAELAVASVGRKTTRLVERAKAVQDVLGDHQDATVAEARLRALLQRPQGVRWAVAAGRLIERQAVRREQARIAFPALWAELEKAASTAFRQPTRR